MAKMIFLLVAVAICFLICGCQETYWGLYSPSRHQILGDAVTLDLEDGSKDTVRIQTGSYQFEFLKEAQDSAWSCAVNVLLKNKTVVEVRQLPKQDTSKKSLAFWNKK